MNIGWIKQKITCSWKLNSATSVPPSPVQTKPSRDGASAAGGKVSVGVARYTQGNTCFHQPIDLS